MTLGLLKYERRPLQHLVDDLYAARGELFDDLFARAWALLDEAARHAHSEWHAAGDAPSRHWPLPHSG